MLLIFSAYWLLTGLAYVLSFVVSGPTHKLSKKCSYGAELSLYNGTDGAEYGGDRCALLACARADWEPPRRRASRRGTVSATLRVTATAASAASAPLLRRAVGGGGALLPVLPQRTRAVGPPLS